MAHPGSPAANALKPSSSASPARSAAARLVPGGSCRFGGDQVRGPLVLPGQAEGHDRVPVVEQVDRLANQRADIRGEQLRAPGDIGPGQRQPPQQGGSINDIEPLGGPAGPDRAVIQIQGRARLAQFQVVEGMVPPVVDGEACLTSRPPSRTGRPPRRAGCLPSRKRGPVHARPTRRAGSPPVPPARVPQPGGSPRSPPGRRRRCPARTPTPAAPQARTEALAATSRRSSPAAQKNTDPGRPWGERVAGAAAGTFQRPGRLVPLARGHAGRRAGDDPPARPGWPRAARICAAASTPCGVQPYSARSPGRYGPDQAVVSSDDRLGPAPDRPASAGQLLDGVVQQGHGLLLARLHRTPQRSVNVVLTRSSSCPAAAGPAGSAELGHRLQVIEQRLVNRGTRSRSRSRSRRFLDLAAAGWPARYSRS